MITLAKPNIIRAFQDLPKRFFSSSRAMVNITIDAKTGFATMELNHPPVNALSLELLQSIDQNLETLINDRIRGLVMTSSLNTVFCAGLDIKELLKPNLERAATFWRALQDVWVKLYGTTFPTAAAINGHSPAGGCLLALCCEYRVMLPNFTIGLNETRLGIEPPSWLRASMQNVMSRRDSEMALTQGTMFTTEEALKVGLIDEIAHSKEEALRKCEDWLEQCTKVSAVARTRTKLGLRGPDIEHFHKNREANTQLFVSDVQDKRFQEEIEAYVKSLKKKSG